MVLVPTLCKENKTVGTHWYCQHGTISMHQYRPESLVHQVCTGTGFQCPDNCTCAGSMSEQYFSRQVSFDKQLSLDRHNWQGYSIP